MNNIFRKIASGFTGRNGVKNLVISVVILIEILAILVVATFAWVETVSSIKIRTDANAPLEIDTYVFTEADIGGNSGTIDMGKYFKPSGDMHFAPCSSVDGDSFYFPKKNGSTAFLGSGSGNFRKGNSSDKNTTYMSVTFKLRADTNADFFFYFNGNDNPTFSSQDTNMRVSVTAYQEGMTKGDLYDSDGKPKYTKVYANTASTAAVVGNTSGGTSATAVEAFSAHKKGSGSANRLFSVGASETKIVTINVWLQGTTSDSNLASDIAISNFGITSSLTPRHVTLLPTPTWDTGAQTYYAWCWTPNSNQKSRLYKLELNSEEEHYTFDYNGTYTKTTFVRAVPGCTVQPGEYDSWPFTLSTNSSDHDNAKYWNQTVDTSIPNDPIDPTYIIETINGGTNSKSTGSWHDPATIKVATCTDQTSMGSVGATSYVGSDTSTHVIESTNSSSQKHKDTVHAWPGKAIQLTATVSASADYAFVGWYNNAEGTGTALATTASFTTTAPSTASEVTYYAKFKEIRTLTIYRYLDGSSSSASCGTITVGDTASSSGTSASKTVDKGTSVTFSASAATGYTLSGIYTTAEGSTTATSPVTLNNNTQYYARFTTNKHSVTATAIGSTGSEVQVDSATKGTSCTKSNINYGSTVSVKAYAASGYEFAGWYTSSDGTGTAVSTDATYSFTLGDADVTYYAKFNVMTTTTIYITPRSGWTGDQYYLRCYDSSSNNLTSGTNGFQQATYDNATGYFKTTFSTSKTGSFYAILAKDSNYTSQVPASGQSGYQGTIGNSSYVFKSSSLATYNNTHCIWFIDDTSDSWINNSTPKIWLRNYNNSTDYQMTNIDDNTWICEISRSVYQINFYRCRSSSTGYNNDQWNSWTTGVSDRRDNQGNSAYNNWRKQYNANGNNSGSWITF